MTKSSTHNLSDAHRKIAQEVAAGERHVTNGKAAPKVAVGSRDATPKPAPKVAARTRDEAAQPAFELPSSMHALAERNVAQTRELYERSKNILHAVLESLEKSRDGTVALNRKII